MKLFPTYYMPQNPQIKISQTQLKHYNRFRRVRTEALWWFQFTTDLGNKIKVETETKHRYQHLLDFIPIEIVKFDIQTLSETNTITIYTDPILNSSFNKNLIIWELTHNCLLHSSDSVLKAIWHHQTLTWILEHGPKKTNDTSCTI